MAISEHVENAGKTQTQDTYMYVCASLSLAACVVYSWGMFFIVDC